MGVVAGLRAIPFSVHVYPRVVGSGRRLASDKPSIIPIFLYRRSDALLARGVDRVNCTAVGTLASKVVVVNAVVAPLVTQWDWMHNACFMYGRIRDRQAIYECAVSLKNGNISFALISVSDQALYSVCSGQASRDAENRRNPALAIVSVLRLCCSGTGAGGVVYEHSCRDSSSEGKVRCVAGVALLQLIGVVLWAGFSFGLEGVGISAFLFLTLNVVVEESFCGPAPSDRALLRVSCNAD